MEELILYVITLLFVYLIYFLLVIKSKRRKNKLFESTEVKYLMAVYKIKKEALDTKSFPHVIAFANAFIITTALTIVLYLNNIILQFVLGLVLMIILNITIYHIIGKTYGKKVK